MYIDKENSSIFLIQKLNNIKQTLNSDPINLSNLKREFESFEKFKQEENYNYLEDLLDPVNRKGIKMPSKMPVATCSFQLHNECMIYTNNNGLNISITNPFLLSAIQVGDEIPYKNGIEHIIGHTGNINGLRFTSNVNMSWVFDDNGRDGETDSFNENSWDPLNDVSFTIPPIYSSYRVVSACGELKYIGPVEEAQGIVGGSILLHPNQNLSAKMQYTFTDQSLPYNSTGRFSKDFLYLNKINNIRKCAYNKEANTLEGIRMLYFPIDNSYEEFVPVLSPKNVVCHEGYTYTSRPILYGPTKNGFKWIFYIYKGPISKKTSFKFEYWINYECTPDPKFMNYIPISINVWKMSRWKISELAKAMEKHAVTAIKKMSGIDFFIA